MRNITVSVDDETYRKARERAAALGTSVSALVAQFLKDLAAKDDDTLQLERLEADLRAKVTEFRGGDRLEREALHGRGAP
jgi:hypothetical protein